MLSGERTRGDRVLSKFEAIRAYAKLLELRQELRVVSREAEELGRVLSLRITADKLYGFTLVLECLLALLNRKGEWRARVDREGSGAASRRGRQVPATSRGEGEEDSPLPALSPALREGERSRGLGGATSTRDWRSP